MDYFANVVNVSFVVAIIVLIEVIKGLLKAQKIKVKKSTWKIIVLLAGIPMAIMMCFIEGWIGETIVQKIFNLLVKCFIYSAASSLIYQTGKMGIEGFLERTRGNG